ncbi:alanine--tRNA ligase [soil metagenome]
MLSPNDLRQKYLQFYANHGHKIIPTASLVPENDPTTLFTSSGMQPLVPYLLGQPHPEGKRLVDSQKSFRSQDIEEVGDNRHTTYFEMLGNWSLGDYFKQEQLPWAFAFFTEEVGLDPHKLFVTVYSGNEKLGIPKDKESVEIWQKEFKKVGIEAHAVEHSDTDGMQDGRIFYYPEKENWWSRSGTPDKMPAGEPGGPDSEVFYDFGTELQIHEKSAWKDMPCHVNCDCGRFLEIGNSVFMQYQKQDDGSFQELPQRNVDFGGGLERILAASQDESDVFRTALFWPIIEKLELQTHKKYLGNEIQMRVITDHIKASTMLIVDGVLPTNKAQGYVLRRLLRRAALKVHQLGANFVEILPTLSEAVLEMYDGVQNIDAKTQTKLVSTVITQELETFQKTLAAGLKIVEKTEHVDGKIAFDLYQSYGFPLELTTEIVEQKGQKVDRAMFESEFQKHKDLSRTASAGTFKGGLADQSEITTKYHTTTHLLQAALRKVLGDHVQQKGSNITAERMRFDFSHTSAMTQPEIQRVQDQMNEWIAASLPVTVKSMQKQEALKSGAIAFFVEKYPDQVTVYTVGKDSETDWVSKELCGGPHVKNTSEIGPIELFKEQSASAGIRRIYAKLKK